MEQTMDSLIQPDTLLPAQYLETIRRENHLDPEKMLMLAVLEDGVICFQKYISTQDEKGKRLLSEAEEWLLMEQNGEDWLFSFDNVCETLGLNPGYIREGLLRWRHHRLRERDQVRPRVNRSRDASRN